MLLSSKKWANSMITKQRITRESNNEIWYNYPRIGKDTGICLCIIFCCINNYPKTQQLKIINIFYLIVSADQEFAHSLARCLCLQVFHDNTVKLSSRAALSYEGLNGGGWRGMLLNSLRWLKIQLLTRH